MQREYIDGDRARHQKPFALFFICATIAGLSRYWIYLVLIRYFGEGEMTEANFFHNYMVLVHVVLIPVYALITFLVFYNSRFNYAEIGVFLLYTISAFFLIVSVITLLRFIWPGLDTMYVELPVILLYNALTCANFFKEHRRWIVVLKSIVAAGGIFFAANLTEELVQRFVS